ncbi:MAG TPA: hypothetical protein VI911_11460 [Patescibacteria group bacterium]|nr:hypothetical protein [Patescibacteria group bacterium]
MASATKTDLRQLVHRAQLDQLTTSALYTTAITGGKPANSTEADNLLTSVNSELTNPLRLYPTDPTADRVVHVGAITVVNPETAKNRITTMINKAMPAFTGATITLPSTANGASNIVVSVGDDIVNYDQTASTFVKCGVWLNDVGEVVLSFGSEGASAALAGTPDFEKKTQFLGYFIIETDASQNIQNIEFADIFQVEGGGSGGGGLDKWEPSVKYTVDDVVWYSVDRNIYVCITEHTSTGTFDETKFELLSNDGYSITLGETIAVGEAIYISKGTANGDTGRTQSYAYKLDITNANRYDYAGICVYGGNASDVGIVSVSGNIKGFTGLTGGQLVYASSTAGGWSHTKPSVLGYKIVILGMAVDATHLLINGGLSSSSETYTLSTEDADTIHLIKSDNLSLISEVDLQGQHADFDGGGTLTAGALTLSTDAADLLKSSTKVIEYAPGANGQNDYFGFTKTIPQGSRGRYLGIQFENRMSATTIDNAFRLCVKQKDGTNAGHIQYFNMPAVYNANGAGKTFKEAAYIWDDCTEIEFGWQNTVTTTTVELYVDNILVTNSAFKDTKLIEEQSAFYYGYAGVGSTNNKIPYFSSVGSSVGSAICTISNSSTLGFSITALRDCTVSMSADFDGVYAGISKNSTELTTSVVGISAATRLSYDYTSASYRSTPSVSGVRLVAGDVLRPHLSGTSSALAHLTFHAQAEVDGVVHSNQLPENDFSGNIANNGTATITSQNSDAIASVSRTSTGVVAITFKTGKFTVAPSVVLTSSTTDDRMMMYTSLSTTGVTVYTRNGGASLFDLPFSIHLQRQFPDYKPLTGNIITPSILTATLFSTDYVTASSTLGASVTIPIDTLEGSPIAVISNDQFSIPSGAYRIDWFTSFSDGSSSNGEGSGHSYLYNITDAVITKKGSGIKTNGSGTTGDVTVGTAYVTISATKTFELRGYTGTSGMADYLFGYNYGAGLGTNITITKLK